MKLSSPFLLFTALGIITLSGCTSLYLSNPLPAPVFNNAGEFQANVSGSTNGASAQVAFAYDEDSKSGFAVMANANYLSQHENLGFDLNPATDFLKYKQQYVEAAWGEFIKPVKQETSSYWVGAGIGKMENLFKLNELDLSFIGPNDTYLNTNYFKIFFQSNGGVVSGNTESIGIFRISYFQAYHIESDYFIYNKNVNGVFLEPGGSIKIGYKFLKFCFNFGASIRFPRITLGGDWLIGFHGHEYSYNYRPFYFGLGVQLDVFNKSH